jgi:hypothetical protein
MKKTMKNFGLMAVATAILAAGTVNAAIAEEKNRSTAELTFIGTAESMPVFRLTLNNSENALYVVTIKDADNNVLYSEKIKGEKISRKYKLDADEELIVGTTFEVANLKTGETTVYKINTNTRFVQEVVVAKL